MTYSKGLIMLGIAAAATSSFAGTVITTDLSANVDAIVNIDGTADGAHNWSGSGQDYWQDPFDAYGPALTLTLNPGTYTFTLVNPTDALAANPNLTSAQQAQIYTAWSYNTPWVTDYYVWDSSALTTPGTSDLFAGAVDARIQNYYSYPGAGGGGFDNATDAYNAAVASGVASQIFIGGRYTGPMETSYTITQTETLVFAIPDYDVYDNHGGVSVMVQSVPEPAGLFLLAPVALGLIAFRKRS